MKKKFNLILTKCMPLSRQSLRTSSSSSYTTLTPKSTSTTTNTTTTDDDNASAVAGEEYQKTIFVGSNRKPYLIDPKYLTHPLLNAIIQKSGSDDDDVINCEVVLFDHLLWMLQNSDLDLASDSVDELSDLYLSN
ncbi:putative small auxin-up RNA [Helianthus annuus]|uniref:Small auxin-up RNA n=1 Tax=Helianthus annuus TaxID=4232 RepID=A0A251UTD1_HELAN|nr:auxin-responsive protein SAUR78 [Helianthus annuus]KAF5774018.1 putative small auxin-up RNA [Helianthus annuus]KAJ0477432.1 putative small auxin-up RNA [Helianthus annuus]KAJ0481892.1 putative small auxin-up RNA [Helianthus annuus]KAJ0498267.1 putative small auxin-up RNA [Helianthus annuus]KAJ0664270.1 putative small auxin-up RNA [Helianthus annuus]